ncbi:MAG: ACT domain-containing protein [Planctomycetes bacterium]|nr:ACT domain-containing protein [Planctomycetota bacterium]MCB9908702.1 ACT domain-containing protein [Planctomycetota bacterium]HPF13931.1 ACT domain-containing protein [Planctomycetota bacterium]HRV81238.1 ACT domain-containing protein [Planctomycetota bacterium]
MGKRFITAEDVRRHGSGPILVDDQTIVTPQAAHAAQAAGIAIQSVGGAPYQEPSPDRGPDAPRASGLLSKMPEPDREGAAGTGVIVTAVGRNRPGILAEITVALGEAGASVVDISQRTVEAFFHLVLTVELRGETDFAGLKQRLDCLGGKDDYTVRTMHEGVFRFMHRV